MKSAAINKRIQKAQARSKPLKEQIQVFCRVRPPPDSNDPICLSVIPPCYIQVTPPTSILTLRNGPTRDVRYTFKHVFDQDVDQKTVFDTVALPSVENVLCGRNALLLTYGVTGSGKTYTMTGTHQDGGIMPRCLDVIFNSIAKWQAKKYIFKPDKLNGFEIQSELEAKVDRDNDFLKMSSISRNRAKLEKKDSDPDLALRIRDQNCITTLDEDNCYAVFVTYIEIYNNSVFDLLEDVYHEGPRPRPLQPKIVREDSSHNMFVHGVNEVEVCSTDEAFEMYYRGQKRKRIAHTTLNSESSRSHSVFTIRIVQAPLDESGEKLVNDKNSLVISQLSLVDLAGSERTSRTKNTGQRLREAGNINNSLLTLRTCLELLRENQNGANKIIPYRDSRLTQLFKNFFDGEGQVTMVICVSPHEDDFDETIHVMKFAEMSQDVQISVPAPMKTTVFTPGRRKALQAYKKATKEIKEAEKIAAGDFVQDANTENPTTDLFVDLPDTRFLDLSDDTFVPNVIKSVEDHINSYNNFMSSFTNRVEEFREMLKASERQTFLSVRELESVKALFEHEKDKVQHLEIKIGNSDAQLIKLKRKVEDYESNVKRLKRELSEKDLLITRNKIEKEKVKEDCSQKIVQAQEKLNRELERRLRSQKSALQYEMRHKENKLKAVKRILTSDDLADPPDNICSRARLGTVESRSAESLSSIVPSEQPQPVLSNVNVAMPAPQSPSNLANNGYSRHTPRRMGGPVSNRRHRRSRSAGNDVWLDHRPKAPVPLNTVMQPKMAKKKSFNKLTDAKDLSEKASKYCLMTQTQDSDGDLETRLYKGDVIPTCGGGAQVMFNDVEILKQTSPTSSPANIRQKFEDALGGKKIL